MKFPLWSLLAFMIGVNGVAQAQEMPDRASAPVSKAAAKSKVPAKKPLTPEEQIAMGLLESSLAGSRKLDAVSQGQAAWEGSRIYLKRFDEREKASALLVEGFASTIGSRDEGSKSLEGIRAGVESRLLKALVRLDVKRAEELLPQAEDKARKDVESELVSYYLGHGNDIRALELVRQMAAEHEMSYRDAITLMSHMKAGQESLRRDLFTEALASFSNHEHKNSLLPGQQDFAAMILRFSAQLPAPMVAQSVEEVLSQAKKADDEMASKKGFLQAHMATEQGEATWTSFYDYELFALLPALSAADPVAAEARIKDSATARALFAKYENGLGDLAPGMIDPAKATKGSSMSMGISIGDGGGGSAEPPDTDNRLQIDLARDMPEHPDNTMAKIPQVHAARYRAALYLQLAQMHWKKHPAVAREALRKAIEEAELCGPEVAGGYSDAAEVYVRMGDEESAKKTLEKGTNVAAKLYELDVKAENPNLAPVIFWPSSTAWLRLVRSGAKISPQWAVELMKTAPSENVVGLGQMVIAASLLKVEYLVGDSLEIHGDKTNWVSGEEDKNGAGQENQRRETRD